MSSQLSCGGRGVLLRILGGRVQHGSLNPDPIPDQNCHFSLSFSDLAPKKFMSSLILRFTYSFVSICLDKENLKLIAFFVSLDLAGQTFSQFVLIITYKNCSFPVSCSH